MAFADSPHTDAVGATFLENGVAIDDMSLEMSFHSPKKRRNDLVSQMRTKGHGNLRTPGPRNILAEKSNLPPKRKSGEFTPLLKSVTKKATFRGKENLHQPQTPAFLKAASIAQGSPDLRPPDTSEMFNSDTESDLATQLESHTIPGIASSSAQSTPVAVVSSTNAGRMLDDQRNLMTLREQENVRVRKTLRIANADCF